MTWGGGPGAAGHGAAPGVPARAVTWRSQGAACCARSTARAAALFGLETSLPGEQAEGGSGLLLWASRGSGLPGRVLVRGLLCYFSPVWGWPPPPGAVFPLPSCAHPPGRAPPRGAFLWPSGRAGVGVGRAVRPPSGWGRAPGALWLAACAPSLSPLSRVAAFLPDFQSRIGRPPPSAFPVATGATVGACPLPRPGGTARGWVPEREADLEFLG